MLPAGFTVGSYITVAVLAAVGTRTLTGEESNN